MLRKHLTNSQKLMILADADERQKGGESLASIARSHGIQPVQIRNWRKKISRIAATKRTKKTISCGKHGRLKQFEAEIIGWGLELQENGTDFSYVHLVKKAITLDPSLAELSKRAQYQVVRRLCIRNCLVKRRTTHMSQRHPQETVDISLQWLEVMRPIFSAPEVVQKYVVNMDQTAVFYSMNSNTSLALKGSRTVYGKRTAAGSSSRFTCSLAIAANGERLKPFLIFKGTPEGRIATREFPTNPQRDILELVCQESAWQDEGNMLKWIDRILVPHLQEKAAGVPAILVLDQFKVHWTAAVKAKLASIGVTLHGIPAGCTSLVQPIDVGIGKPFKDRMRTVWWDWMIEQDSDGPILPLPSREIASQWVAESWNTIGEDIVKASWRKSGFSYFVDE